MTTVWKDTRHIWLLAALVVLEIVNPLLAGQTSVARLFSATLLMSVGVVAVFAALDTTRQRWLALALALPAIAVELARHFVPAELQLALGVISNLSVAAFLAFVVSVIVRHVFARRDLGIDDVVGAFAGYIMIGLLWGRLYALTWLLEPRAFSVNADIAWQLGDWHSRHALFDYFSLVTLATVGYGDITTTGPASTTLRWLEVMCGQFYLAVVVATIVGLKLAQALDTTGPKGR